MSTTVALKVPAPTPRPKPRPRLSVAGTSDRDTARLEQHEQAFKKAKRYRLSQAGCKRAIAAGELRVVDVLRSLPDRPELHRMEISALLVAPHRWGMVRTRKLLAQFQISEDRRLGDLTDRQSTQLIAALEQLRPEAERIEPRRVQQRKPRAAEAAKSSPTLAPSQAREQRLRALERGNWIRMRRAALRRGIKAGRRSATAVLQNPEEFVVTMKVRDLLLAVPKIGKVKCDKILDHCQIPPARTVGDLTKRQRAELVRMLQAR